MTVLLFLLTGGENKLLKLNKINLIIIGGILVLFATMRSSDVGTDSNNYVGIFNEFNKSPSKIYDLNNSLGLGYLILQKFASFISSDYWSLFLLIALVCVWLSLNIIYKVSRNIRASVIVYLGLCTYFFMYNGARQALAISLVGYSILYILGEKKYSYYVTIIMASMFHITALIMLPFYTILRKPLNRSNVIILLFLLFMAFYNTNQILSFFSESTQIRYSIYEDRSAKGGYLITVFYMILTAFFLKVKPRISKSRQYEFNIYLNMCLVSSCIYLVTTVMGSDVNFLRLTLYFSMGYILIWPIILDTTGPINRKLLTFLFGVLHLVFMCVYILRFSDLYPYTINKLI